MALIIELPSGLRGEARKIRGAEAVELAERAGRDEGGSLAPILRGCWLQTLDPGPYTHATPGSPAVDWDRVLKGDLVAGLLVLRAASIQMPRETDRVWPGKLYRFAVQCERCRKRYEWQVNDIRQDLPVRALPPESVEALRAGVPFSAEAEDADGGRHQLTFNPMLPEQDAVLRQLLRQLGRKRVTAAESLAAQTVSIDGSAVAPVFRQRFFQNLDLGELNRLRDIYDAADCGVETAIMTTCDKADCEWEQEIELPFTRTFFKPDPEKASRGGAPAGA